jgi:hypothetical protein
MKQHAVATMAIGMAAVTAFAPGSALAQPATLPETRSVPFGDTAIVLSAPKQHCLLDTSQAADEQLTAIFFRPREGKTNTYLGAFIDCDALTALRSKQPRVQILSYGYYLAFTLTASHPLVQPRDRSLQAVCNAFRASDGSLDLASETAKRELEARMEALPIDKPWFGPVIAQDENGCYQIILNKRSVLGVEHREALLTVVTFVKGRQVTYTSAAPYFSAWLPTFVRSVQSDVAAFVASNP